jgi:broad specificity phosphatase PhoE
MLSRKLWLVRHAKPRLDPSRPASQWTLSDEGEEASRRLGERLAGEEITAVLTSSEPKAHSTAWIVGERLGIDVTPVADLGEHRRESVGWLRPREFRDAARRLFERPDERVFGEEAAHEARARFENALQTRLVQLPPGDVVVVAHGAVITLFVDALCGLDDPFAFWAGLEMPALVAVQWPDGRLLERESFADWERRTSEAGHVVAVDLGLRCGIALFRQDGELVSYRSTNFGSRTRLKQGVYDILADVADLRRVVVEGDTILARPWRLAADRLGASYERVAPETWREELLDPGQRRSGAEAKRSADELAREVIARSELPAPTSLTDDAAEAILIGVWATTTSNR